MTTTLMTSRLPLGRASAGPLSLLSPRRAALALALTSAVITTPALAQNIDDKKAAERGTSTGSAVEPPAEKWDQSDVEEKPSKQYLFVGARYRGTIVPKFMMNIFVDEGKTVYSNAGGIELDLRKDGFSIIPSLTFQELSTGDILFKEKNTRDIPQNYSMVNSSLYVLYGMADLLWSTKISKNVEFEYGAGVGVGAVFGGLVNNWVREDPNGALEGENGKRYTPCETAQNPANGNGCNKAEHQNSDVDKVGRYVEKDWFTGGSQPTIFPWISLPQIGLRFKPIKQFVARLGMGFSLTGFWFGLSGQYGLEQKPKE